ncbi:MAG: spore germination protein [Chloroflexi bacterium]|nr:spore germination protein [Chloroflexota bacterium]
MNRRNETQVAIDAVVTAHPDITCRCIRHGRSTATLLYVRQIINHNALADLVIRPLVKFYSDAKHPPDAASAPDIIYADDFCTETDLSLIEKHLLDGMTVLLFSEDTAYLVINLKKVEKRSIPSPELSYTLRAPRDCFVENLETNLSLLRYRIKDKSMKLDTMEIGERTKSKVVVAYLDDIANPKMIAEIKKRLQAIRTDGIMESGELANFICQHQNSVFPQTGIVERSDLAVEGLLEGKVIIFVDGSCLALIAPRVLNEFLYSDDDRSDNQYYALFIQILRNLAFLLSFMSSSFYIAIASFHIDILPASYILQFAQMRNNVPFTAAVAVLIMEFLVELIREALLRVPKQIGPTVGIIGGIIIGQAAIAAGFFTPVLLILISVEMLASFAMPDYTLMIPFRIFKFLLIFFTSMLGFCGFTLGIMLILIKLASTNSFGVPYLAPFAPFNWYDFIRTYMFNRSNTSLRQQYLRNKDNTRAPGAPAGKPGKG